MQPKGKTKPTLCVTNRALSQTRGSGIKKGGGNDASLHSATSDSVRVRGVEIRRMRWTCCMSHVVIATTHYTVFVLPQLLICFTKQAFGLALPLPGHTWTRTRDAKRMSMASRTLRTGKKRAVFTSLDIRGYIRRYSHWTEEEYLCRRIDLSPFHGAEESQEKKKQKALL